MAPWRRTYAVVWIANAITAIGMMSFLPFFPGHLQHLGLEDRDHIATWTGVIFGAAPFVAALASPVWGSLGDRYGRRLMLLRALFGAALFVGLMGLATSPWQLLALRVGQGLVSGFVAPSQTLVSVTAPPDMQGRVSGGLQMALAFGAILGPLVGGEIVPEYGLAPLFFGVSVLLAASALLVWALVREGEAHRRGRAPEAGVRAVLLGTVEDFRQVMGGRRLRFGLLLLFVLQFGVGATHPLMELFVGDLTDGVDVARRTARLVSLFAVANLVAMSPWGRLGDRFGFGLCLAVCSVGVGATLGLHAIVPTYVLLLVARAVLGSFTAGAGPLAFGLAAAETPESRRGGAFGVVFSARALAISLSAFTGGALEQWIGLRGLFLVGGGFALALGLVGVRVLARSSARHAAR